MIAVKDFQRVSDLMAEQHISVDELMTRAGVERRVVEAIAQQRYTPSPDQRQRVCNALGVSPDRVVWGHAALVEHHIHAPD